MVNLPSSYVIRTPPALSIITVAMSIRDTITPLPIRLALMHKVQVRHRSPRCRHWPRRKSFPWRFDPLKLRRSTLISVPLASSFRVAPLA